MQNFRLTGGTLITLIVNAIKKDSAREVNKNGHSNTTNPLVLEDLICVANFNHKADSSPNTSYTQLCSKYKNCINVNSPTYLDFSENSLMVINFRKSMNNYPTNCLKRAKDFTTKWIGDNELAYYLVNSLLSLIQMDENIKDAEKFYLDTDLTFKTKKELFDAKITLSNLILSCWFYVHNKQIANYEGRDTILYWYNNNTRNKFKWDKWVKYNKPFDIVPGQELVIEEETDASNITNDENSYNDNDETIDIFEEETDAEPIESEIYEANDKKDIPNVVFNNYGGTQNNVVNYGNITITVGGKKNEK